MPGHSFKHTAAAMFAVLSGFAIACGGDAASRTMLVAEPDVDLPGVPGSQPFDHSARETATVLAASAPDTVWSWPSEDGSSTVIWTTAGNIERWRSEHAFESPVNAELLDLDADSVVDLFWTIDDGDVVGGAALFSRDSSAELAYGNWEGNCAAPEIWRSVYDDGLPDIIRHVPSSFGAQQCFEVDYSQCVERYPTAWATLYAQTPDGAFVVDTAETTGFYSQMAYRYSQASVRLQVLLNRMEADSTYEIDYRDAPCTMDMRWVMDSMAVKAYLIANPGSELPENTTQ